jgi:predicted ATPase
MILQGWVLVEQGQSEEGIAQIRQGLVDLRATGTEVVWPYFLGLLAQAYGKAGQAREGIALLDEALTLVDKSDARWPEAELYRLKGELLMQQGTRQ